MKSGFQILLLLFLVFGDGFGQTPDSVNQIEPYVASEIPANLVELDLLIEDVLDAGQPTAAYQLMVDSIQHFQDTLNATLQEMDTIPTGVALQILEIQKNRIRQFNAPLQSWNRLLVNRTEALEELSQEIKTADQVWQLTLEQISQTEVSELVISEISTRLDSLNLAEQGMSQYANSIIEYEVRINQMSQQIEEVIDRLDEFLEDRLWARDSPPIWALETDTLPDNYGLIQLKSILVANKKSIATYYELYRPSFYVHMAVFLIILVVFMRIRYVSKRYPEYQDLDFLYHTLGRPVLSAILISLIFALGIYTNGPQVLGKAMGIVALLSLIGIFYGFIHQKLKLPLLILGLFYVFNYLQSILPVGTVFQRSMMGFGSIALIGYSWWVINLFRTYRPDIPYGWLRGLVRLIPFATFLIIGSLLANVVGSVRLSKIIFSGVINSAGLALIFYGAVRIVSNVIAFALRTPYAHVFNLIRENFELLERRVKVVFQFLGFVLWLRSTMIIFGLLDMILEWFQELWNFGISFGSVTITIGGILGFFLIVIISWWLARILQLLLERELFDRLNVSKGIPHAISTSIYYVFIALGFLLAVSYAGFDLNQISLVIGALGVGIGFGLQNVISNFVSGLILTFERPINVGDTVEVGPLMGNVSAMGLRSSKVKTFDGSEVIVPNSNLVSNEVINWTLSDNQRRLTIPVATAYGSDPHKVLEVMRSVVSEHPKVLSFPTPMTLFDGFGDSSLNFRVLFWVYFSESLSVNSEVALQIYDALKQNGIEIPIPLRMITMKPGDNLPADPSNS